MEGVLALRFLKKSWVTSKPCVEPEQHLEEVDERIHVEVLDWEDLVDEEHSAKLMEAFWWIKPLLISRRIIHPFFDPPHFLQHQFRESWQPELNGCIISNVELIFVESAFQELLNNWPLWFSYKRILRERYHQWHNGDIKHCLLKEVIRGLLVIWHTILQLEPIVLLHKLLTYNINHFDKACLDLSFVWIHHLYHVLSPKIKVNRVSI